MKPYRILVTGTREALTEAHKARIRDEIVRRILGLPRWVTIVHGACPTGVDAYVDKLESLAAQIDVERHPADWRRHGRPAGPRRNAEMVALGADVCLAFPLGESRGTRGCAAMALAAGIETRIIELGEVT